MKKLHLSIAAVLFALASSLSASVETGSIAPDFTLTDTTGASHSLSDFSGKYVVLEWTNHLCPFVVKFYQDGHMQAMQKEMAEAGVVWLQIISSAPGKQGYLSPEAAEALRKEQGVNSTAKLLDTSGEVGRAYDARTTPHMYLIDTEGVLVYQGAIDSVRSTRTADIERAENYLLSAYESHSSGKAVENGSTSPYGCSVKY